MQNLIRDDGISQSQELAPQQTAKGRRGMEAVVGQPSRILASSKAVIQPDVVIRWQTRRGVQST